MKLATFLMLVEGKVFIPSLRTLQHTDPLEALLLSRAYSFHSVFYDRLWQDESFQWIHSKAQNWERDYLEKYKAKAGHGSLLVKIWLRELASGDPFGVGTLATLNF